MSISIIEYPVSGGGGSVTADNGLVSSSDNVQLGSASYPGAPLLGQRYIDTGIYGILLNRSNASVTTIPFQVYDDGGVGQSATAITSVNNTAIVANSTNQTAVGISSTNGIGAQISSTNGISILSNINPSSTNTVATNIQMIRSSSGTAANGIGVQLDMQIQTSNGTNNPANAIISKWSNATHASRTSEFSITGISNTVSSTLFTLSGDGGTRLNKYGTGTFTGTGAYTLQIDASGNIIEAPYFKGGQSPFTADGVATVFDIVHNLGATPSYFTLTTTAPIATNHLARTITFPDVNTLRITFNSPPNIGEDANYVWIVYK